MTIHPMSKGTEPDDDEQLGLDDLTAAESALAERKAGQSIATLGNEAFPQVGLIGALGWVLARRREPKLTFESYMSSRKLSDITRELGLADDDEDEDDEEGKEQSDSDDEST